MDYIHHIEKLILDLLAQDRNNGKVFLSKHGLLKQLNMINGNYSYAKRNIPKLSKLMEIDEKDIHEFYDSADSTLKRNIENAMETLKDKSLISYCQVKTICVASVAIERNELDRAKITSISKYKNEYDEEVFQFNATYRVNKSYREATEDEERLILHTEKEIMKKLKCKTKTEIIQRGKWEEFDKKVKEKLMDKANILFYFDSYKILFNEDHILEERDLLEDLLLDDMERILRQESLNSSVSDRLVDNVENRHSKAAKENEKIFGKHKNEKINRRSDVKYIENGVKLADTLINSKHAIIKEEMRRTKVK